MNHLNDRELRRLIDDEIPEPDSEREMAHLQSCEICQTKYRQISQQVDWVDSRFQRSSSVDPAGLLSADQAYRRFLERVKIEEKEKTAMNNITSPKRLRPMIIALGLLVLVLALLAVPSFRAVAGNFLGLFRVQQVAVVEINPSNLPEQLGNSNVFEELISQNVTVEKFGASETLSDIEQARARAGFNVRLPQSDEAGAEVIFQPGSQVKFDVDLSQLNQLIDELGYGKIDLPRQIDGSEVVLTVQPSLATGYGNCNFGTLFDEQEELKDVRLADCIVLVQTPSPTIDAPAGLNLPELGKDFLQVMGLKPDEAEEFSRTVDWTTTLVIPIPRYGTSYETVSVDGVEGTLIRQDMEDHRPNFLLIWVKDGIIYSVTGPGTGQNGLALADSME
jgi:hypothetical protein